MTLPFAGRLQPGFGILKFISPAHRLEALGDAEISVLLNPSRVADEICRVLSDDSLVYADTLFMQQVHEGAYDFTRFTRSGYRWLFRRFAQIDAGVVNGPGTALV